MKSFTAVGLWFRNGFDSVVMGQRYRLLMPTIIAVALHPRPVQGTLPSVSLVCMCSRVAQCGVPVFLLGFIVLLCCRCVAWAVQYCGDASVCCVARAKMCIVCLCMWADMCGHRASSCLINPCCIRVASLWYLPVPLTGIFAPVQIVYVCKEM